MEAIAFDKADWNQSDPEVSDASASHEKNLPPQAEATQLREDEK